MIAQASDYITYCSVGSMEERFCPENMWCFGQKSTVFHSVVDVSKGVFTESLIVWV